MKSIKTLIVSYAGTLLLSAVLLASLTLNVYQALILKGAFLERTPAVRVGANFPVLWPLSDPDGKPVTLNLALDTRSTVLYILSPACGWCKRNEANIKALAEQVGSKYRFIGLSISGQNFREYVLNGHAPFSTFLVNSSEEIKKLELGSTPQTLIVSSSGRVEEAWQGAYIEKNRTEIEKYFGVRLPGLQDAVEGISPK